MSVKAQLFVDSTCSGVSSGKRNNRTKVFTTLGETPVIWLVFIEPTPPWVKTNNLSRFVKLIGLPTIADGRLEPYAGTPIAKTLTYHTQGVSLP